VAVVVITGSSSGFGLATSLAFARRGDRVYATMRNLARAGELRAAATSEGLEVEVLALDVTRDESVREAVEQALGAEGRIDVLVNNAGVGNGGAVETLPNERMRAVFETNLFGAVRMIRAVLPGMRACNRGVIVNVSSVAGRTPGMPTNWAYSASKHALGALSDSLAFEVEPFGVRVVCIEPGFFSTRIQANATPAAPGSPYEKLERAVERFYEAGVASGGDPRVVADAIVQAANDPASPIHVPVGETAAATVQAGATLSETEWAAIRRSLFS
jgi:NAD(P)-dependent dehydrogenase (short-subunit alcohol dehydrogenase family)